MKKKIFKMNYRRKKIFIKLKNKIIMKAIIIENTNKNSKKK